jgi:CHAD domain-containing protein
MASLPVLARLIARPLEALAEHLPAALHGDSHGIHQARVASRRLRELLPIVGDALDRGPRRRLRRRLRQLTRALGPVRELDVALASIERMTADLSEPLVAASELSARLSHERASHHAKLVHRFDPARVERLLGRLHRLESALAAGVEPRAWRSDLAERVTRRAIAFNAAVADAGALFSSERLHAVRIAAKQLRYALEVVGEARMAATGSMVRSLKDTQDVLGKLHDADVLLESVRRLTSDPANEARLSADVSWFDREITAETRRLHAKYLRRQAALVRLADAALDTVAPRIARGARPAAAAPAHSKARPDH